MRSDKAVLVVVSIALGPCLHPSAQTAPTNGPVTQVESSHRENRDEPLEFPPISKGTVSLIGGTVIKVDPIRDRVVLRAFGGREVTINFDVRTKVLREESAVSPRELRPGARIYADTALVDGKIFAKTIRVAANAATGDANGQVTAYDPTTHKLEIRNALASEPLEVRIGPETTIRSGTQTVDPSSLTAGSLVHIIFSSRDRAKIASQIEVLAQPGSMFTFAGTMTFVDLRTGLVAIADQVGNNSYEVAVDHLPSDIKARLKEGTDVVVHAKFDGQKYQAQTIDFAQPRSPQTNSQ